MTLVRWSENGWLKPHRPTPAELVELFALVERDLEDARTRRLSADWQFSIAYNAALKLCTILVHAEGYRAERNLAHYRTLQALVLILGPARQADADYLEACRTKRNTAEYDSAGRISPEEARELVAFATELRADVELWLNTRHPALAFRP